jgi:hypothetical protein
LKLHILLTNRGLEVTYFINNFEVTRFIKGFETKSFIYSSEIIYFIDSFEVTCFINSKFNDDTCKNFGPKLLSQINL